MQTAQEIQSNIKNLKYYSGKITELAKKQYDIDYAQGNDRGMNTEPGKFRFDSLAIIIQQCAEIEFLCQTLEVNLNTAIKQDKHLYNPEYIEGIAEEEIQSGLL